MTWYPIAFIPPQYEDSSGDPYSGAVLKCYEAGTSTVINMATDYTGGTTATSMALNASGFPEVSGSVVIPHVEENYKLALYPTQAAADANSGAIWTVDNIQIATGANADRFIAYASDTGSANAYVLAPAPAISAYAAGQYVTWVPANANTGASTLTISGLASKNIKLMDGTDPYSGAIVTTGVAVAMYNGTSFILLNPAPASGSLTGYNAPLLTPRVQSVSSAATVTPTSLDDEVIVTAQGESLTIANVTGTMTQGQGLVIRLKDDGTGRAITFGSYYRAIGVTLPTTTTASKTMIISMIWNATDTKFDVTGVAEEA